MPAFIDILSFLADTNYSYYWNLYPGKIAQSNSSSISTAYIERPIIVIPTQTRIIISEFNVSNSRYTDCNLLSYPTKTIKSLNFTSNNSPFVFNNLITYSSKLDTIRVENKFFVNEITNYPESKVITNIETNNCGKTLSIPLKANKEAAPEKFYYLYSK